MFLAEQNSIPIEGVKTIGDKIYPKKKYEETENIEEIKYTDDLNLIILHRSLYILKKKFELYKPQFRDIYNKYSSKLIDLGNKGEILENEILVEKSHIGNIIKEIINKGKFEIDILKNFKDAVFKEMKYYNNININEQILNDLINYANDNRRKYNFIYKEKKINKNFKLESYLDYIPQGDDELTKIVIEVERRDKKEKTIKNDNISEIVPNKLKGNEFQTETNNELESEISNNKDIQKNEKDKNSYNGEILLEKQKKVKNNENGEEEKEEGEEEEKEENEEEKEENKNKFINRNKKRKKSFYSEVDYKKSVKYAKNYLYIESLPLIIADFISNQNNSYIILDHADDLRNDLRALFDNEILSRLGEEVLYEISRNRMEQLKDLLINKAKVEKNISCYEDLLYQMRTHNQNVSFVLITINKLKDTLNWVDKKISVIQDDTNTFNEYENNLKIKRINEEIKLHKNRKLTSKTVNQKNYKSKTIIKNDENYLNNINPINFDKKSQLIEKSIHSYQGNDIKSINESKKDNEHISRRLSSVSEISILKLDKKIEGMDTARLIDSNLINKDDVVFMSKRNNNIDNTSSKNVNIFNVNIINKQILPKIKSKTELTKEEKRELNLREIFNFYSHQHSNAGHKTTFDAIRDKFEHLNLSEFGKFCVEFKIMIPKEKLIEIFKKSSTLTKEMSFQEFKVALTKISVAINNEKIKQLKKRIKHFKNTLNYNNKNITIENLKKEQVDELILKCKEDIKQLNKKAQEELIEELYEYLQIDDEEKYHQKMKGFVLPIFHGRILQTVGVDPNTKNVPVKVNIGRQIYIKEMIEKRKEQKKLNEKKVMRANGLDRECQKKRIELNNSNSNININNNIFTNKTSFGNQKKNKLEPIKQNTSNYSESKSSKKNKKKIINDILSLKNKDELELYIGNDINDNSKKNDRYLESMNSVNHKQINNNNELNGFPRKLNDLINDQEAEKEVSEQLNFNYNNYGNIISINPLLPKNKNNSNIKENKYTWDSLQKMKSSTLVDEEELNRLINKKIN